MGIRAARDAPAGTGGRGCARVGGTRGAGRSSLEMLLQNTTKGAGEMPGIRRPWLPAGFETAGALSGNSAGEPLCPWPRQAAVMGGLLGTAPGSGRGQCLPSGARGACLQAESRPCICCHFLQASRPPSTCHGAGCCVGPLWGLRVPSHRTVGALLPRGFWRSKNIRSHTALGESRYREAHLLYNYSPG